jgi:hypothetical protein
MRILGLGYQPEYIETKEGNWLWKKLGMTMTKMRNNLVQIKTGEGKSIILAVLSIIFALSGFEVRCACYS